MKKLPKNVFGLFINQFGSCMYAGKVLFNENTSIFSKLYERKWRERPLDAHIHRRKLSRACAKCMKFVPKANLSSCSKFFICHINWLPHKFSDRRRNVGNSIKLIFLHNVRVSNSLEFKKLLNY